MEEDVHGVCGTENTALVVSQYPARAWIHPRVAARNVALVWVGHRRGRMWTYGATGATTGGVAKVVVCGGYTYASLLRSRNRAAFFVDLCMAADRLEEEG